MELLQALQNKAGEKAVETLVGAFRRNGFIQVLNTGLGVISEKGMVLPAFLRCLRKSCGKKDVGLLE